MITLYQYMLEHIANDEKQKTFVEGRDTEFEAIIRLLYDREAERWGGFIVFKDVRFSPLEDRAGGIQLRYWLNAKDNEVYAYNLALAHWRDLCDVFSGLLTAGEHAK